MRIFRLPVALVTLLFIALAGGARAGGVREFSGEIDGALYRILAPGEDWNGSLWIEAHGLRDDNGTPLIAELSPSAPFNAELLKRGWAVATTSYRRNGIIVDDAITDVLNLRDEAAARLGPPKVVVVEGSSMGGSIGTLLAESDTGEFTGVVAAGAALQIVAPEFTKRQLTHAPRIPIVFLTNQSELDGPAAYVAAVRAHHPDGDTVVPVLWKVLRDGHVNVNAPERLAALDAVVAWAETGKSPGDREDATVVIDAGPSTATVAADGSLRAKVTNLARVYGNLYTDLRPADFEQAGIKRGDSFTMKAPGGTFTVLYGKTYGDVPVGDWVAFPIAEGTIMISRNHANAAETAGLAIGDAIVLHKASTHAQTSPIPMTGIPPKDFREFAADYTAAWCSGDAARVAAHFSIGGSLKINNGDPAVDRPAITAAAQGFMTAFPDMVVTMDKVHQSGNRVIYEWTLTGTNTGPGGTGNHVRISGSESWLFGADGLIAESLGTFDEAEYNRQLGHGVD